MRRDIAEGDDVTERLTHLAAVNFDVVVVQPDVNKLLPSQALTLSNLVGVMHRNMIDATSVNVNCIAQRFPGNGRTFEVPARKTDAPRAVPFHVALGVCRRKLPDGEVGDVAFALDTDPGAGFQSGYVQPR